MAHYHMQWRVIVGNLPPWCALVVAIIVMNEFYPTK